MRQRKDIVVVGAGFGGLTAACLLADRGADVTLLEAHTVVGGCAGGFDRILRRPDAPRSFDRFRFDAGATTLSGLASGHPLRQLFDRFDGPPPIRRVDPGMIIHQRDSTRLSRFRDADAWIAELERAFGSEGQRAFWSDLSRLAATGWHLALRNRTFPPQNLRDYLGLVRPHNLRALPLLRSLPSSILDFAARHRLAQNAPFLRLLDELTMITAQNVAAKTPLIVGAMGLVYPEDTWYADGGLLAVAEWMERTFVDLGGDVRKKHEVTAIEPQGSSWVVRTNRETFLADRIVANLTLQDLARVVSVPDCQLDAAIEVVPDGWGALGLHMAVPSGFDDGGSLYHQIHADSLPHASSGSIFVSFSAADDRLRAPEGFRTLSVSTHVADPGRWVVMKRDDPEAYRRCRQEATTAILTILAQQFPTMRIEDAPILLPATPASFAFFTRRHGGAVGGIPHTTDRSLFAMPNYRTPFEGIGIVGDTVFPGQGVPAVILGAMNLVDSRMFGG